MVELTPEKKQELDQFITAWSNKGEEVADKVTYWNALLHILGVPQDKLNDGTYIEYEKRINWKETGFHGSIDAYIPSTKVLIEQKSFGVNLGKAEMRPNGGDKKPITPLAQAKRYDDQLAQQEKASFFVLSNFSEIWIYDRRTNLDAKPIKLKLNDLKKQINLLNFLVRLDKTNEPIEKEKKVSLAAGALVSQMYDELTKIFEKHPEIPSENVQKSIITICVRLVFCLYAEDAGLFDDTKSEFHDYLAPVPANRLGIALKRLFEILDTDDDTRLKNDPFYKSDDPVLAKFPYVNGGMFHDQDIIIPPFTEEMKDILLNKASRGFDWSEISPTIFGAVFESTLNPETRRQGGMHYTSVENIHKVIDPLFLDKLKHELQEIKDKYTQPRSLANHAQEFQDKLSKLTFLDPACGSGNFLTETYLSLRRLENEAISIATQGASVLETGDKADKYIKVSIQQFYGIEINDFAVSVAKTALWIAEDQMMKETQDLIYGANWDFLPLKTYTHIHEGNALRMDWQKVLPNYACHYIIGNPPFVGPQKLNTQQKEDRKLVLGKLSRYGLLDYVACWYLKAVNYMQDNKIRAAFVSTSSITQGSQVPILWKPIFKLGFNINFAYRSFLWQNETKNTAEVVCVIIGFSKDKNKTKYIFDKHGKHRVADDISPYLTDNKPIFIEYNKDPICKVPPIMKGLDFLDNKNYILTSKEKDDLIQKEPEAQKYIHPYYMSRDFLNRKPRYCLFLNNADPSEIKKLPLVLERVKQVQLFRENKGTEDATAYKDVPMRPVRLRYYSKEHNSEALVIPRKSAQRSYIPMDIISKDAIGGSSLFLLEVHSPYMFGVLESKVHTAWVEAICTRLGSGYSYSNTIVYNNFPWPKVSEQQKEKISKTAQAILDARNLYPNSSLADLYHKGLMPVQLVRAHKQNDKAVLQAYGLKSDAENAEIVSKLFEMYQNLQK